MSRIGILPVEIPEKVEVSVDNSNVVRVKGPLGELSQEVEKNMKIKVEDNRVIVERPNEQKKYKSMHGLYRSLINNMVIGVSQGFETQLEFVGVGFRAETKGQMLEMSIGYSHDIHFRIPDEIQVEAKTERRKNPVVTLKSFDKQLLGHVVEKIRSLRRPEPYKGKGIKFVGEEIRRKAGKAAAAV